MAGPGPTTNAELEAVTEALVAVEPSSKRLLLFGSRARGDARPDSVFDLLVVVGAADAERLAGSRWHVVARGLREGMELHDAS